MWEKHFKVAMNDNEYIQFIFIHQEKKIRLNLFETQKQELRQMYETLTLTKVDIFWSGEELIRKVYELINDKNWITVKYMFLYFTTLQELKTQTKSLERTFKNKI